MHWTLIVEASGRPGSENMSVDYSLLRRAQGGFGYLRLYRWDPPCLSFGRNEPALGRYDREEIERCGLATVRRPTGGRAVWHDAEVTYAVAAPTHTFGSLRETYNIIHATLATALRRMGVPADLARRARAGPGTLEGGACFASPVGGEVITPAGKLVGSAQVREGEAFLQHGSILLEDGQDVVARVSRGDHRPPVATSLAASLQRAVDFTEVSRLIADQAEKDWGGAWEQGMLEPAPGDLARFADPTWTWRR